MLLSTSFAVTNINDPLPHISEIQYKVYDDVEAMTDALLIDQEIEMMPGTGRVDLLARIVAAGYNQTVDPSASFGFMATQNRDVWPPEASGGPSGQTPGETTKPLNDSRFRLAMTYVWGMDNKSAAIYEYMGNELTVALGQAIPPAQGGWSNNVDIMPDTDWTEAWSILTGAGYTVGSDGDAGYLLNPDGSRVRDIEVVYSTGSLSWEYILGNFVAQVNSFFDAQGCTNGPNFILTDREFMTLVYQLMSYHDFDYVGIGLTGLGLTPDWCYENYHSAHIGPWEWNFGGFINDTMDTLLETMMYDLDEPTVRDAVWEMQRLFNEDWVPLFLVTTGNTLTTWHPDLTNFLGSPGPGADQCLMNWMSVHWDPAATPPFEGLIRRGIGDEPDTISPWTDDTLYGWLFLDRICEPLMLPRPPDPSVDMPWLAYKSEVDYVTIPELSLVDGMKVTYYLRNDVLWQDSGAGGLEFQFTADDCQWALTTMKKWQVGRYARFWNTIVYTEAEGPYKFTAYFGETSLWYEDYPQLASYFPKHIYYILDEMADQTPGTYDDQKLVFDGMVPDEWDYKDWTAQARILKDTSLDPLFKAYYALWPVGGMDPRDSNAPQTANVGVGAFVYDYYTDSTRVGQVHSNDIYWVDGPIKAVVDSPYVAENGTTVEYNAIVANYGYKVDGELANKTVTVEIYENDVLQHTEVDEQVNVWDWVTLGPYTTAALPIGDYEIRVDVLQGETVIDTYTHTVIGTIDEDLDRDGLVDIRDIAKAARAFGSDPLHEFLRWDPDSDITGDYLVDIRDIAAIARKFGWPG
jgi:hypothetical protein